MAKNDYFPNATATMNVHLGARSSVGSTIHSAIAAVTGVRQVRRLPDALERWLVGLRLLERVPFHYLIPDARLLPPESARFFYLDRTWTDRLVEGAMSAGAVSNGELELARDVAASARAQLDQASGTYGDHVTGFFLRSTLVRRWPRMEVRAYKIPGGYDTEANRPHNNRRIRNVRIARLSESILLALWHGVPNYVEIEEPKHGLQFGVNADETTPTQNVEPRSLSTGQILQDGGENVEITTRQRVRSAAGVLDIQAIADAMDDLPEFSGPITSQHMALALQQMPFIQPFRGAAVEGEDYYPEMPPAKLMFAVAKTVPLFAQFAQGTITAQAATAVSGVGPMEVADAVVNAMDEGVRFLNEKGQG